MSANLRRAEKRIADCHSSSPIPAEQLSPSRAHRAGFGTWALGELMDER